MRIVPLESQDYLQGQDRVLEVARTRTMTYCSPVRSTEGGGSHTNPDLGRTGGLHDRSVDNFISSNIDHNSRYHCIRGM